MEIKPTKSGGNRFIKGRRQEAQAEIEGWIAETRAETVKGRKLTEKSFIWFW